MIPWFVADVVERLAWWFGYSTDVSASCDGLDDQGGRWQRSRCHRIHFVRRLPGEKRPTKLKPWDGSPIEDGYMLDSHR